jgi:3-deoxy-D-manno-octulosonate 8-phosphate phosphatase (KDO 8-P phosphatase)
MNIQWIVLDVDGVLSDGTLIYTSTGEELKAFSVKDGLGLTAARKSGIKLAIITAPCISDGRAPCEGVAF